MYKNELKNLIASKKIPKSLLIYGECEYQSDFYLNKILSLIGEAEKLIFYFDEYNFASAKSHISQASLFGDINILIIKHNKKILANELKKFIEIAYKNSDSYFIFQFLGEALSAKELQKFFNKKFNSNFVRFFKLNLYEAKNYLINRANELKIDIDSYTLEYLFMLNSENLALSINELEKLSILNRKINPKDINQLSVGMGEIGLEEFIKKLLNKEDITDIISSVMEFNEEVKIINSIQNYLTTLFMFHSYIKIYGKFDSKEILGYNLPPKIANERASEAIKIDVKKYQILLEHLINTEFELKKAKKLNINTFLLHSLIKLQTLL